MAYKRLIISSSFLILFNIILAQHPDQHYVLYADDIYASIEINNNNNIVLSDDGLYLKLAENETQGYIELKTQTSASPFNRGLPSWNGLVSDDNSGFHIQMRFPYYNSWPNEWYTVGYWKEYIWNDYGSTNFTGGKVDIDYVKLNTYQSEWQFRVNMKRQNASDPSPKLNKLSFFVSDSKTENNINYNDIVNDNPGFIYCDTDYIYQYSVDTDIGGDICSPTSTVMALNSLGIEVDELIFARDNYDTYWGLFGIWPNAVQNASEYMSLDGLYRIDGAVTRYRNWSDAFEVLNNGGRIVMSVGPPLYTGHLMMLAGFMEDGRVIVHDPAAYPQNSGFQKIWDKAKLSESWFKKGGISYTFYLVEKDFLEIDDDKHNSNEIENFKLYQNYPNPFNSSTNISFTLIESSNAIISVYDINGKLIETITSGYLNNGNHTINWNSNNLPSGTYYIQLTVGNTQQFIKSVLLK